MQIVRRVTQIAFLGVFLYLMISGKAQFWMGFIFASIALTALFGRFYCGWACPIHTLMGPVDLLGKALNTQKPIPPVLRKGNLRIAVFLIFLVGLGYTIYSITQGRKFPLPLIIIPFGLVTTFFINPTAWHRYLCPWGTFFSLTGGLSKNGLTAESCSGCRRCEQVCPTESISFDKKQAKVDPANCLLCFKCQSSCQKATLKYTGRKTKPKKCSTCHT